MVTSAKYIVMCFDESFNWVYSKGANGYLCTIVGFKQKQSDSKVLYFSLGHTKTKDLYNELTTDLNNDILPRILQVFKDGPSVNWNFFDALNDDFDSKCEITLLEMGSCELHVKIEFSKIAIRMQFHT